MESRGTCAASAVVANDSDTMNDSYVTANSRDRQVADALSLAPLPTIAAMLPTHWLRCQI